MVPVTAHIPVAGPVLLRKLVREAVEKRFGLAIARETRTVRVYVLTAARRSSRLQPAGEDDVEMSGGGEGSMAGTARTMLDLAAALEGLLNVPVVDETGLKGRYNYSASSKLPQAEGVLDMARQLGLELTAAERRIEMLVVRRVQ